MLPLHILVCLITVSLSLLPIFTSAQRLNIVQYAPDETWLHYSSMILQVTDANKTPINLDDTTQFPDGQLTSIAMEAFAEMEDLHDDDPFYDMPGAMSALQVKNGIYLSSSLKRNYDGFAVEFPDSESSIALTRCAMASAQESYNNSPLPHGTKGNCGEAGAVHIFHRENPDVPPGPLPAPARMVTVTKKADGVLGVIDPCGKDFGSRWGCNRFLRDLSVRGILKQTAAQPVPVDWQFYWGTMCL